MDKYGMVTDATKQVFRNYQPAVNAAKRIARKSGKPAHAVMLLDCKFHVTSDDPAGDWRAPSSWTICTPDGKVRAGSRSLAGLPKPKPERIGR